MDKKLNREDIKIFAFDFDGVIAKTQGYNGPIIGEPNTEAIEAIRKLKELGHYIVIHSTRGSDALKKYCEKHNIPADYFNENPHVQGDNPGKPVVFAYIDDRAICYRGQSAETLVEEVINFKPHR